MAEHPFPPPDDVSCIRCGRCCKESSPTLHKEDVALVDEGILPWEGLYTIRAGEAVWDPVHERNATAHEELIKIREGEQGCLFFEEATKACRIYAHRPVQCAALFCKDPGPFMAVYSRPKARRRDLIRDPGLLRLVETHESRCGHDKVEGWVSRIPTQGEEAVEGLLNLLRYDYRLREMLPQRLGIPEGWCDLLLGRPLWKTLGAYGLTVILEPDGSFLLTPTDANTPPQPGATPGRRRAPS